LLLLLAIILWSLPDLPFESDQLLQEWNQIDLAAASFKGWVYLFNQRALYLNFVRHVEVVEAVLPQQFLDDIGPKQVETNKQERCEALLVSDIDKAQ
jgi:hypothetical protein